MIVAVDSSVLISVFRDETGGTDWLDLLLGLRAENRLVACDVVWAEIAPLFSSSTVLSERMGVIGVHFSPLDETVAFEAGQLFARYRKRGGSRNRMIADFMIAAHALHCARGLATADEDFMRAHFPRLKIFKP